MGKSFSNKFADKIKFLQEYISIILDFKTEINYAQRPLLEILENYSENRFLFSNIKKCIELAKKSSFENAWREAFSNLKRQYFLNSDEEEIVKKFGSNLGKSDVDEQINYCEYNLFLIKPYLKKAIENQEKNKKLPIILGFCISLIVSIVLV